MNIAVALIAYFGIKETQLHPTLVHEEDNRSKNAPFIQINSYVIVCFIQMYVVLCTAVVYRISEMQLDTQCYKIQNQV